MAELDPVTEVRSTREIEEQYELGLRMMTYKRHSDARELFKAALQARPSDPEVYKKSGLARCMPYNLGHAERFLGNTEKAVEAFYACIKAYPGCYLAFASLRIIFREQGDKKKLFWLHLHYIRNLPAILPEIWRYVKRCERDAELFDR